MPLIGAIFFALAVFDAWYTSKRIPQLGLEAEYNPLIKWLSRKYGVVTGIYVGVLGPTVVILAVGCWLPCVLIYLFGCRTTLCAFQVKVLRDEQRSAETSRRASRPY